MADILFLPFFHGVLGPSRSKSCDGSKFMESKSKNDKSTLKMGLFEGGVLTDIFTVSS